MVENEARRRGISESVLDAIGDTPMLEIEGIYCKLEYLNPSGSIKARIARYMIERAEREGLYYGDNDLENLDEVQQPLLEREAPTVVVNGHIHRRDACAEEQVLQVSCSALYEPPYEITLLDLEAEESRLSVRVERIPVAPSSDEDARLSILSPARQRWVFDEGAWYSVESAEPRKETRR